MELRRVGWALLAGLALSACNNCEGWSIPDAGTSSVSEGWARGSAEPAREERAGRARNAGDESRAE